MAEVTIAHLTEAVQVEGQESEKRDNAQLKELATINKSFSQYFKAQKEEKLDKVEEEREAKTKRKTAAQPLFKDMVSDAKGFGFLGIIGAIGAALTGLVVGFLEGIKDWVKLVGNGFKLLDERIFKSFFQNKVFKPLVSFFDALGDIFRKAGTGQILKGDTFKVFGRYTETLRDIATKFKGIIQGVRKGSNKFFEFFGKIGDFFRGIGGNVKAFFLSSEIIKSQVENLSKLGDAFKPIAKSTKDAGGLLSKLAGPIKSFFGFFKRVGKFLGGPLVVGLFAIFDTFVGAFKGFTETEGGFLSKIMGAISGAISGFFSGLVGGILDLGKMIVGWVAGLFGFDAFKEKLAEFSFTDMIFDVMMFPFRTIMSAIDAFKEGGLAGIGDFFIDSIVGIFDSIKGFVAEKFGGIGRSVAGFFGFGGDEETPPEPREIRDRRVVREPRRPRMTSIEEDLIPELRGMDAQERIDFYDREQKSLQQKLKIRQEQLGAMTAEQRASDERDVFGVSDSIKRTQQKIAELEEERRFANVPPMVVNAPTSTTTNNSSNTALVGDGAPATDDLDRVA